MLLRCTESREATAALRLVAFPHAGGSANAYTSWAALLPETIELWVIHPPGRGARASEAAFTSLQAYAEAIADAVQTMPSGPLAFFGHSFGSLAALSVVHILRERSLPLPLMLAVSAHGAPSNGMPESQANLSQLSDAALLEGLEMFDFAPADLLELRASDDPSDRELLRQLLAPVRADLAMREAALADGAVGAAAALPLALHAFGGRDDRSVDSASLGRWARHCADADAFTATQLPGGHFYLADGGAGAGGEQLVAALAARAAAALASAAPSVLAGPPLPPAALYVHEMVAAWAERTPHAPALLRPGAPPLSYRELVGEARLLAAWLVAQGAAPKAVVATCLEHCAEYLIGQLACGFAGGACFPLEAHFGPQMLRELLCDAAPVAALVGGKTAAKVGDALRAAGLAAPALDLTAAAWRDTAAACAPAPAAGWPRPAPTDAGILTMTSGTTGKPKCILCPHVAYATAVAAREAALGARGAGYAPAGEVEASNVMFVWEAARPLCFGHTAVAVPDGVIVDTAALQAFLGEHGVTRVLTTPSLLATLLDTAPPPARGAPALLPALRTWLLCGEVVPAPLVGRAAAALPHVQLVNDYSSWEGSDVALALLAPLPPSERFAPCGHALPSAGLAVLEPQTLAPVARGAPGELFVCSPMLFSGYLGAPELTAQRLLPVPAALRAPLGLPAAAHDDARMYRTGDRARLLPDGQLQVLGRLDSTVKIRGFKVGLGYVEATLLGLAGVSRCAVVPHLDEETGQPAALVAHVLPDADGAAAAAADERAWLSALKAEARKELPPHAVPQHWMLTPMLGRRDSVGGGEARKLDRRALPKFVPPAPAPAKPAAAAAAAGGAPPTSAAALEGVLSAIWAEVLGVDDVAPADNFFDLGGHSLAANKLVAAVGAALGKSLTVLDLFDAPTVRDLARLLLPPPAPPAELAPPAGALAAGAAAAAASHRLAIVGVAGMFPGAADVDAFWEMLAAGRHALTTFSAAQLAAKGVPAEVRAHAGFVPAAYMVHGAQHFDASFFGITPHEAQLMDPQHRLFMQVAWGALEHAGYAPRSGSPARTAVFASAGIDGYLVHHLQGKPLLDTLAPGDVFLGEVGNEKDYIATRVSYALDLMGPALSVNSACSSALAAVAQAAQAILTEQAEMAVAGGAALTFPGHGYLYEEGLVNSTDGKVRPFDADASGTVFGDAVGAVVLKRLAAAEADDDHILATILGFGVSNDGARKAGYAAPGVAGQKAAVGAALQMAGVPAQSLSYVECHATGTLIGDGIELRALAEAHRAAGAPPALHGYCAIGSIKGNIGHANAAAGVTGLIKAALCLQRRELVPTAHYAKLNAKVALAGTPFYVHEAPAGGGAAPWPQQSAAGYAGPRRCGVSSFGIGGTNVHMVLEEAPPAPLDGVLAAHPRSHQLVTLAAKTPAALGRAAAALAAWLEDAGAGAGASLARVAHTLHLGREPFAHRLAVVAAAPADAAAKLRAAAAALPPSASAGGAPKPAAPLLIFPGQGSQCAHMGEGLYRTEPRFKAHVDRMCAALAPQLGFDLREWLYPTAEFEAAPGYAAGFGAPRVTQPAIFVTELALGRTLLELGVRPAAMGGHSIGEWVAATLAGVFDEADALRLIAARARLCEDAAEGAMLAVPGGAAEAAALAARVGPAHGGLWLALSNADGRQVLAGAPAAVAAAEAALRADGKKCRRLPISRAYHTPMMAGAQAALGAALRGVALRAPSVPLCCNGTGGWMDAATATSAEYWAAHCAVAVRWADNMARLAEKAPACVVEVGSGHALAPLLAECAAPRADELTLLTTLRAPKQAWEAGAADARAFGEALGALWEARAPELEWRAYHEGERFIKAALPTYSFEPTAHWVNPQASMYVPSTPAELEAAQAALDAAAAPPPAAPAAPALVRLRPAAAERRWATAYCLAYAGGSTAAFAEMARGAPEWLEVVGVEMPGKGELADVAWPGEPAAGAEADEADEAAEAAAAAAEGEMVRALAATLRADAAGGALVLVGWSMGGMLAAELALHLHALGAPPQLLHVAGRMAPGTFVEAGDDVEQYVLASEEVKQTDAWRDYLQPLLLADLRADARAERRVATLWSSTLAASAERGGGGGGGGPPLRCALHVCCGDADVAFPPEAVDAWRPLSGGAFATHTLRGGHDILQRRAPELLRRLVGELLPASQLYAVQWAPLAPPADAAAADAAAADAAPADAAAAAPELPARIHHVVLSDAPPPAAGEAELAALRGGAGLLVYLPPLPTLDAQQAQAWGLLTLVQRLTAAGGAGRLVLLCASSVASALAAGASKAVPLEYPELEVQRLFLGGGADLLHSLPPALAALDAVVQGWLRWLADAAAAHRAELDLFMDAAAPLAPLAPRLAPRPRPPPSSKPAVDPAGTYLITGGSGGMGSALVAWLLHEQRVPAAQLLLLSRRGGAPTADGVRSAAVDLSSAASIGGCAALRELLARGVTGVFHLAGVLDDGLIENMDPQRLRNVVAPKAGLLPLLAHLRRAGAPPAWVMAASSTSSLLGYAGQANYCAANALLDHAASFDGDDGGAAGAAGAAGGGGAADGALGGTRFLTLNFGPWGEVGMAREGTKAHQLSLASGELPMASSAAVSCIAEALRRLQQLPAPGAAAPSADAAAADAPPRARGLRASSLQFAVADVEWWRSPWPNHPLLQGFMRRLPPPPPGADADAPDAAADPAAAAAAAAAGASAGGDGASGGDGGAAARERVEAFLRSRLSVWEAGAPLVELGLDSLDLVGLRTAFQKAFKCVVPLSVFTNANQTLEQLLAKLADKLA